MGTWNCHHSFKIKAWSKRRQSFRHWSVGYSSWCASETVLSNTDFTSLEGAESDNMEPQRYFLKWPSLADIVAFKISEIKSNTAHSLVQLCLFTNLAPLRSNTVTNLTSSSTSMSNTNNTLLPAAQPLPECCGRIETLPTLAVPFPHYTGRDCSAATTQPEWPFPLPVRHSGGWEYPWGRCRLGTLSAAASWSRSSIASC